MAATPLLESAAVRFPPGFVRRLELLVWRQGAARERGEARRSARADVLGDEFAGFRPYRDGEDVRHLDWSALARLDRPFVRVHTGPTGERWHIALDTSGSMGLGAPGKLGLAAQVAVALAALGQRAGARTTLHVPRTGERPLRLEFARRRDLPAWIGALEALRSTPASPAPAATLEQLAGLRERAARVFVLGDLQDLRPEDVLALRRPGRHVGVAQILAPHELELPALAAARLVDRESGARLDVAVDARARARYAAELGAQIEGWRRVALHAGLGFSSWSSAQPFEDVARGLLEA